MNVIICTKAVPGFINRPTVPDTHDRVEYEAGSIVINESDDYALEAGIKLAHKTGGKATVLTVGPLSSQKVLQTGLGKDADAGLRVDAVLFEPAATARALAAAVREQTFDLLVTGVESSDVMAAQVGVALAEMLGLPFAYAVTDMQPGDAAGTIRITKELGYGRKQVEEIALPALVCFQTGTEPPSFVPVRKMMMAQRKPIMTVSLTAEGPSKMSTEILDIFPPPEAAMAEFIEGDAPSKAAAVLHKIREVL